jgi:excisionase family DNA binding protein
MSRRKDSNVDGTALPTPEMQPTVKVAEAGRLLGLGRAAAYEAVRRGDIPSIRIGRRVVVPTAALRRMLQLDDDKPAA